MEIVGKLWPALNIKMIVSSLCFLGKNNNVEYDDAQLTIANTLQICSHSFAMTVCTPEQCFSHQLTLEHFLSKQHLTEGLLLIHFNAGMFSIHWYKKSHHHCDQFLGHMIQFSIFIIFWNLPYSSLSFLTTPYFLLCVILTIKSSMLKPKQKRKFQVGLWAVNMRLIFALQIKTA